jgi:hypothetical protein
MRLVDVSLRTLRVKLIASGARWAASLLGFLGILVWLLAAGGAMQNLSSPLHVLAYAGGFAAGTALGMRLEEILALGVSKVQAVSREHGAEVAEGLREQGLGATAIRGEGRDGEVEITIEDDGPGIPPENLTKIFDRFYTHRPDEDSFGKNSGLGLNISHQIITAHGGRIWAENRSAVPDREGRSGRTSGKTGKQARAKTRAERGARFVIRLPAA